MARRLSRGATLLGAFLVRHNLSRGDAGQQLKVSHVAVFGWVSGRKVPTLAHREAIAIWTHGEVPVESWPADPVVRVKPFKPTGT